MYSGNKVFIDPKEKKNNRKRQDKQHNNQTDMSVNATQLCTRKCAQTPRPNVPMLVSFHLVILAVKWKDKQQIQIISQVVIMQS